MTERTTTFPEPPLPVLGVLNTVNVFVGGPGGGNPVPFVADASAMTSDEMLAIAKSTGHESAFVLAPVAGGASWRMRFFVPKHEMEMCGHATVGTLWALRQWGLWDGATICVETLSGLVDAVWDAGVSRVWISQPAVQRETLTEEQRRGVAEILGLPPGLVPVMTNASTSRIKTLIEMPDVVSLNAISPDFTAMEALCASIGSTGLYPFAMAGNDAEGQPIVAARQFPKSSGYPEDAATGIAAAALWGHLAATGAVSVGSSNSPVMCTIRQGEAMGRPSAIEVRARFSGATSTAGCWLSGHVTWDSL